ncbi:MAG TPA: hypothetical protein VL547_10400 [Dinghuibacter sp.]|uniref:hypothetical protein n=1 Tax=Dinghuibacter sp. TaxID=2024697 RepID=UPI002CDD3A68|nr:hypothetical protein [Dinghuibacter sp.]HTJ12427.1 hypothetical protein [Dinghuibacter sp.]
MYPKSLVVTPGGKARAQRPEADTGVPAAPGSTAMAAVTTMAPAPAVAPLKYLGENGQHILILVRDGSAVFLEEKAFQFLLSVLEACKLSMADVALVNLAGEDNRSLESIAGELGSRQVLLFGIEVSELGLPMVFPEYQVQPHGNRTYLAADDLARISAERTLKGRLWACLKQLFQR